VETNVRTPSKEVITVVPGGIIGILLIIILVLLILRLA
jgi:nitrate reductase gamma subunit